MTRCMNCVNTAQISHHVKKMEFEEFASCQVGGGGPPAPPPVKVEPAEGGKEEMCNGQPPTAAQVIAQSKQEQCIDLNDGTSKIAQVAKDVNSMKTPNGGIKKTKQQRKEALFKKKRLRSVLTHKVARLCDKTFHNISCSM